MSTGAIWTGAIARTRTVLWKAARRRIVFVDSLLLLSLHAALPPPEHVVKFFGLVRRKLLTNGVARLSHLFADIIANQTIQKLGALLAFMDDVQDLFALLGRELQFFCHAADEFFADWAGLEQNRILRNGPQRHSRREGFDHD